MLHTLTTTIARHDDETDEEIEIAVSFRYCPGERQSSSGPGCPPDVDILDATTPNGEHVDVTGDEALDLLAGAPQLIQDELDALAEARWDARRDDRRSGDQ